MKEMRAPSLLREDPTSREQLSPCAQLLSPQAATTEASVRRAHGSGTREDTTRQLESSQSPLPATREKSMQATKNYHN